MQGVTDCGAKACIAEIRWRLGAETEGFVDEMDWEGRPLDWGLPVVKGWSG